MSKFRVHLKQQLAGFLDEVSDILADDKSARADILIVKLFFSKIDDQALMNHVVKYVLPHKREIKNRKEKFFIENTDLYKGLPEGKVKMVSELWMSGKLTDEDKDVLWEFFDCFIELAESHEKCA
jgi:hypothetical protein